MTTPVVEQPNCASILASAKSNTNLRTSGYIIANSVKNVIYPASRPSLSLSFSQCLGYHPLPIVGAIIAAVFTTKYNISPRQQVRYFNSVIFSFISIIASSTLQLLLLSCVFCLSICLTGKTFPYLRTIEK